MKILLDIQVVLWFINGIINTNHFVFITKQIFLI